MANKLTIHERCQKCGRTAARQDSDGTVHTFAHGCFVGGEPPRSFLPIEVIFVPISEPLTDDELDELEQWGTRLLHTHTLSRTKARRIVQTIKTLQDKNKQLLSDFNEMTKDCAKLQKILFDIGHGVRDALGIDIVQETISPCTGMWQCTCDMWNYPWQKNCVNCGRHNALML